MPDAIYVYIYFVSMIGLGTLTVLAMFYSGDEWNRDRGGFNRIFPASVTPATGGFAIFPLINTILFVIMAVMAFNNYTRFRRILEAERKARVDKENDIIYQRLGWK
jgi:uncharacterized membrane protein